MTVSSHSYLDNLIKELLSQKEKIIESQLLELVNSKVLLIEETQPVIIQEYSIVGEPEYKLKQAVKLTFKGEERLRELQEEVIRLRQMVESKMNDATKDVSCGKYTFYNAENGCIWVRKDDGEGMQVDEDIMDKIWEDHF